MRAPATFVDGIMCQRCGEVTKRTSAVQKFCAACSGIVDTERKRIWARNNPQKHTDADREEARAVRAARHAAGSQRRGEGSIVWQPNDTGSGLAWMVRASVPFSYNLSKNALWSYRGTGKGGHVFMRTQANAARGQLIDALSRALAPVRSKIVEAKVFIDIFVQKPDHRGDAINVIDSVCDGAKVALGVDDRWFAIRAVDWEIVKSGDCRVWIGIGQEATEHHRACSLCGSILALEHFDKSKSALLGRARECKACKSSASLARKAMRAAARTQAVAQKDNQ